MIIAVTLSSVIVTLALLMLTVGLHTDRATARGRHYVQSLHVAESGIEHAIAKIEEGGGNISSTAFTGSTEVGTYSVTVTNAGRNTYTVESTGAVRQGGFLGTERTVRVSLVPPSSFRKAVFSYTTVETKNNDIIQGDVWANHNVILAAGTQVQGSVVAAAGYVQLGGGAIVEGDATSGGFDPTVSQAITLGTNARVDGDATASVVNVQCAGADNADYKVNLAAGSVIGGDVRTWGTVQGSGTILGTTNTTSCTSAPPTEELPEYTFAESNYDSVEYFGTPDTESASAVSDFGAYLLSQGYQIEGTFYINQSGSVNQAVRVDLTGVTITGDTTIIANTPIYSNGVSDSASDAIFTLVSTYDPPAATACDVNSDTSECAVHLKNNFSIAGTTAVLVYAPFGPVAIKNNAEQFGAIYADSLQVKNNQTLTYDPRVERVVGFGDVTLEQVDWQEIPSP